MFGQKVIFEGYTVTVTGMKAGYYRLRLPSGASKWIPRCKIQFPEDPWKDQNFVSIQQLVKRLGLRYTAISNQLNSLGINPNPGRKQVIDGRRQLCITHSQALKVLQNYGRTADRNVIPLRDLCKEIGVGMFTMGYQVQKRKFQTSLVRDKGHKFVVAITRKDAEIIREYYNQKKAKRALRLAEEQEKKEKNSLSPEVPVVAAPESN